MNELVLKFETEAAKEDVAAGLTDPNFSGFTVARTGDTLFFTKQIIEEETASQDAGFQEVITGPDTEEPVFVSDVTMSEVMAEPETDSNSEPEALEDSTVTEAVTEENPATDEQPVDDNSDRVPPPSNTPGTVDIDGDGDVDFTLVPVEEVNDPQKEVE